jgi:hypothetical protein
MCLSLCVLWYNTDPEVCFAIFAESELMRIEMLQRIEERRKKPPPVVMQDAPRREIPSPPAVVELPPQASSLPSPPPPPERETVKKPSSILSKPLANVGGEDIVLQQDIAKQSNSQQPGQQSPVERPCCNYCLFYNNLCERLSSLDIFFAIWNRVPHTLFEVEGLRIGGFVMLVICFLHG